MLYREQTFAPHAFHSELQQQTNTVNTQKSPPCACDKGYAEACAGRFPALNRLCGERLWYEIAKRCAQLSRSSYYRFTFLCLSFGHLVQNKQIVKVTWISTHQTSLFSLCENVPVSHALLLTKFSKCRNGVDSSLCPRNHNYSTAKPFLFSWSLGDSKWR